MASPRGRECLAYSGFPKRRPPFLREAHGRGLAQARLQRCGSARRGEAGSAARNIRFHRRRLGGGNHFETKYRRLQKLKPAARAASAAGVAYCLSHGSVCTLEQLAKTGASPRWMQVFIYRDRGFTEELAD